ncbi:MAG: hypothetical protein JEY79_05820 [Pseudodesulfovibrio sp.]|nr:hypothetical protein [Pseudodesulfovibrio sp.]
MGAMTIIRSAAIQLGISAEHIMIISGAGPLISSESINRALDLLEKNETAVIYSCVEPDDHPCQFRKLYNIDSIRPLDMTDQTGTDGIFETRLIEDHEKSQHGVATLLAATPRGVFRTEAKISKGMVRTTFSEAYEENSSVHCVIKKESTGGEYDSEAFFEPVCGMWRRAQGSKKMLNDKDEPIWGRQAFPEVFCLTKHITIGTIETLTKTHEHLPNHPMQGVRLSTHEALLVDNEIDMLQLKLCIEGASQ